MRNYEELVKRLREHNGWALNETLDQAADAIEELSAIREEQKAQIIAMAAEGQHWISVTERLPKEADGMVFVLMPDVFPYNSKQPFVNCNQDRRIDMAHYSEHSKTWYFGDCGAVGGQEPIAWIHRSVLPEPPKEDNLKGDKSMIIIRTNLEELPTTCCDCPLKTYDPQIVWKDALMTQWGGWVCPISGQLINNTKREDFCPLEEIPEPPKEE